MTVEELLNFIKDASIADDAVDSYLEEVFVISSSLFISSEQLQTYSYRLLNIFQLQQKILARDVSIEEETADLVLAKVTGHIKLLFV